MKQDTKNEGDIVHHGDAQKKSSTRTIAGRIPFPRNGLKDSLKIPEKIWQEHAGEPWDPILLAKSLGTTNRSSVFVTLLTSAERYGLTSGKEFANAVSLTDLGKSIVAPTDETSRTSSLRKALLAPKLFADFYNRYDRKNIPKEEFVRSALEREFAVPRPDVDACFDVLKRNIRDYNLSLASGDSSLLYLDNLGAIASDVSVREKSVQTEFESLKPGPENVNIDAHAPPLREQIVNVPRAFISHSKNKKILENMKQMLAFGKFDYRVAEEKETLSIPLSDKVFGLMRECNCAIINVSADQEKKSGDSYEINENVLLEIGAAFLHYEKRILLVIDQRLKERLPSILQGITAIFYEGQELSLTDGMKLMQALGEFRNKLQVHEMRDESLAQSPN